jgi:hypothetical protein
VRQGATEERQNANGEPDNAHASTLREDDANEIDRAAYAGSGGWGKLGEASEKMGKRNRLFRK